VQKRKRFVECAVAQSISTS